MTKDELIAELKEYAAMGDTEVAHIFEHMEHVVLLNRAFADGVVSPDEAEAIRRHYFEEVTPAAEDLSVSFRAIHSITRSKGGIYGYRFQRMCKQAWARLGESNVVDLFPRVPMDAA